MERPEEAAGGGRKRSRAEADQYQAEQSGRESVQQEARKVVPGRGGAEQLDIQRVAQPGERMPVQFSDGGEGEGHGLTCEAMGGSVVAGVERIV
jgi:hypothetical protein